MLTISILGYFYSMRVSFTNLVNNNLMVYYFTCNTYLALIYLNQLHNYQ